LQQLTSLQQLELAILIVLVIGRERDDGREVVEIQCRGEQLECRYKTNWKKKKNCKP